MNPLSALALGLAFLYLGAELCVCRARSLALRSGVSPVVAGLTLVAYGTSAPELFVGRRAVFQGHDGIVLGNVVGSNICNVLLILGLCALVRPMSVHAQILRADAPLLVAVSLLVCSLLLFGGLGRAAGILLVAGGIGEKSCVLGMSDKYGFSQLPTG